MKTWAIRSEPGEDDANQASNTQEIPDFDDNKSPETEEKEEH